jgi:hypothetical protein
VSYKSLASLQAEWLRGARDELPVSLAVLVTCSHRLGMLVSSNVDTVVCMIAAWIPSGLQPAWVHSVHVLQLDLLCHTRPVADLSG